MDEALIQYDWCPYKKKKSYQECLRAEERSREDTARRQLYSRKGERPPERPALPAS